MDTDLNKKIIKIHVLDLLKILSAIKGLECSNNGDDEVLEAI